MAKRVFELMMSERALRLDELGRLLERNGVFDIRNLVEIERWFNVSLEASPQDETTPSDRWFAVGFDLSILVGEEMIRRSDGRLCWRLLTKGGKRAVGYHFPVIASTATVGFEYSKHVRANIMAYAHRVLDGSAESNYFEDLVFRAIRAVEGSTEVR